MAPIRNNTSGMDRDDDCAGIKSDRKVGEGFARVIGDTTLVSSCHKVACIVFLLSVDQETSGGEEKKGPHQ